MIQVGELHWTQGGLLIEGPGIHISDPVLMQFTGLQDAKGNEIYEGDIVRIGSFVPQVWQVGFNRGGFCFFNEGDVFYNDIKYCEDGEVIGNIYENPELLKNEITKIRSN